MRLGLALAGLTQLTCNQAILTATPEATITLFANPPFIPAHGGVSVISALVLEKPGTAVPDGTVVQFVTTLGRIDEQGKTNDGVARVNLVADSRSGTASVTAFSGAASASLEGGVKIGAALPTLVILTAFPTRLTDKRASLITANVFDASGNPVANVPVIFKVDVVGFGPQPSPSPSPSPSPPPPLTLTEFMDSQGSPTFTDNNGQAQDVMRTRYDPDDPPKVVRVTATVPAGAAPGEVLVTIN